MSKVVKYTLDISLRRAEKKELRSKQKEQKTKYIVIETNSLFWYNTIGRNPKLLKLYRVLPGIRNARVEFYKFYRLKRIKLKAVRVQRFALAANARDKENLVYDEILKKYSIASFEDSCILQNKKDITLVFFEDNRRNISRL